MLKEKYLTAKNIRQKSKEWLDIVKNYTKKDGTSNFSECALLVIDMQNFFLNKKSHAYIPSAKTIIPNIKKIITICREKNIPIIFTRFSQNKNDNGIMVKWWNDKVIEGGRESKIIEDLKLCNDIVIQKNKYSAFHGTNLCPILKERGIKTIIITGVMTHLCCDATARDAFMHDFNIYFIVDATASYNEDLHLSSLKTLSHGFVNPICTGDLIEKIKGQNC